MTQADQRQDWVVGIDVGGTFTDVIGLNRTTGEIRDGKVLSTVEQEDGVLQSLTAIDVDVSDVVEIVHGHTVGINALLSRTGRRTALLATEGHRDLLDIGRMHREFGERFYDPTWRRAHQERPIVERGVRYGVPERLRHDGSEILALDESAVREAARAMRASDVESVAICMVNSYRNAEHERRAAEIIAEEIPGAYIQTSALYPVTREHERTTTVALDAYVGPTIVGYLNRLMDRLLACGFSGTLWIMTMNGGVATFSDAARAPVFQLVSGPVGGVSGSTKLAKESRNPNLLTIDVGGTSTDVAAIRNARTPLTDTWTLETGLTLTMPLVDVESIGSGAGSIIGRGALGGVAVGPSSAGSNPGPVCYRRGGTEPTLTDACAALGILQPDLFANGAIDLDIDSARKALEDKAKQWDMSGIDLASSAYEIACQDIAAKVRTISVYRGFDLADFALQPSGSAGPMLADRVAQILGIDRVVVPRSPGQFSAMGLLRSDLMVTKAQSIMTALTPDDAHVIEGAFRDLECGIRDDLDAQGVDASRLRFERAVFAMYRGQTWDNRMSVEARIMKEDVGPLVERFHEFYRESYGFAATEIPVVISTVEVTAIVKREQNEIAVSADEGEPMLRKAHVTMPGSAAAVEVPVYMRERMQANVSIVGPALVSEKFATTLVLAGRHAYLDDDRNLVVESITTGAKQ